MDNNHGPKWIGPTHQAHISSSRMLRFHQKRPGGRRGGASGGREVQPAAAGVAFILGLRQKDEYFKRINRAERDALHKKRGKHEFLCLFALSQRPERSGFPCLKQPAVKRNSNVKDKGLDMATVSSLLSDSHSHCSNINLLKCWFSVFMHQVTFIIQHHPYRRERTRWGKRGGRMEVREGWCVGAG